MSRTARLLVLAAACLLAPGMGRATADLELDATLTPPGTLVPGSVATITLRVSNHGPDVAVAPGVISSGYEFIVGGRFDLFPAPPNACTPYFDHFNSAPGEPHYLVALVHLDDIAPGESQVCTLGLFVYPEARNPYELSFHVDAFGPDPDATNDEISVLLPFVESRVAPIPALKTWWTVMLVWLVVVAALQARQRSPPSCSPVS